MSVQSATDGPSYAWSGWIEAMVYVVCIGVLSVTYAVGHRLGCHPIVFILYAMLVSAIALLAIVGPGADARAVVLHPASWLVGLAIILIEVFYYVTLENVTPVHGNMLVRNAIPMAILCGWILLGRRPPGLAMAGALLIAACVAFAASATDPAFRLPAAAAGTATAAFMVVRGFSSEFHPWNRAAKTVTEKLRVTGLVVLVTSIASIGATAIAMWLESAGMLPRLAVVPTPAELWHLPSILLGGLVGSVILTAMAYLNFSCAVKITTENFTAMTAFTPVAALLAQQGGMLAGVIQPAPTEPWQLATMALMVAGVLLIFYAGRRARMG